MSKGDSETKCCSSLGSSLLLILPDQHISFSSFCADTLSLVPRTNQETFADRLKIIKSETLMNYIITECISASECTCEEKGG